MSEVEKLLALWGRHRGELTSLGAAAREVRAAIAADKQAQPSGEVAWQGQLADALDHFLNPAISSVREASYHGPATGADVVGAMAQGLAAVAAALRESTALTAAPTPPSVP